MIRPLVIALLTFSTLVGHAAPPAQQPARISRTWTSSDGRAVQGELLEASDKEIKIKLATNFQIVKIPLEKLSADDIKFVNELVNKQNLDASLKVGPYADKVTGQFVKATSPKGLLYQFMGNPSWDNTQRYPLLIWLHGAGQSGNDNEAQVAGSPKPLFTAESQAKHPCFVLMPQCPDRAIGWKGEVADNLMALIADMVAKLPIDPNRIYLTGSSMGGSGTWTMIAKWPNVFAAAVPLCGGADLKTAESIKHIPIWVFHGDKDDQVPTDRSRTMVAALKAVNGNVQYTELVGEGHLITGVVYPKPELHEWLFQQKKADTPK